MLKEIDGDQLPERKVQELPIFEIEEPFKIIMLDTGNVLLQGNREDARRGIVKQIPDLFTVHDHAFYDPLTDARKRQFQKEGLPGFRFKIPNGCHCFPKLRLRFRNREIYLRFLSRIVRQDQPSAPFPVQNMVVQDGFSVQFPMARELQAVTARINPALADIGTQGNFHLSEDGEKDFGSAPETEFFQIFPVHLGIEMGFGEFFQKFRFPENRPHRLRTFDFRNMTFENDKVFKARQIIPESIHNNSIRKNPDFRILTQMLRGKRFGTEIKNVDDFHFFFPEEEEFVIRGNPCSPVVFLKALFQKNIQIGIKFIKAVGEGEIESVLVVHESEGSCAAGKDFIILQLQVFRKPGNKNRVCLPSAVPEIAPAFRILPPHGIKTTFRGNEFADAFVQITPVDPDITESIVLVKTKDDRVLPCTILPSFKQEILLINGYAPRKIERVRVYCVLQQQRVLNQNLRAQEFARKVKLLHFPGGIGSVKKEIVAVFQCRKMLGSFGKLDDPGGFFITEA